MNIKENTKKIFKKITSSALEYKFPSFFAFLFSISSIILVTLDFDFYKYNNWYIFNIAITSMLGFFLTLVAYFSKRKNILIAIFMVLIGLYFYSLPLSKDDFSSIFIIKHITLILICLLLLLYIPFHNRERDNKKYLNWALNIAQSTIVSLVFGVILYIPLSIALVSIKELFDLHIHSRYFAYLAILIFGIFSSHYFLSSLNKNPKELEPNLMFYNKIGKFFSKYILTTIVVIYSLILVIYIIRILILQELPKGEIVWLSLTFATSVLITYIFWTPYENKYKKLLILIGLVQLPLLFLAIFIRISQYGWTTNRYMIVMVACGIALSFLYILLYKKYRYEHIFLAFAILLFISQYGYKINSYYVNDMTYLNRLKEALLSSNNFSEQTDKKIRCDISSSIKELYENRNIGFLNEAIPDIYKKYESKHNSSYAEENYSFAYFVTKELGFKYLSNWACKEKYRSTIDDVIVEKVYVNIENHKNEKTIDISQYDIMYEDTYKYTKNKPFEILVENDKYILEIPTKNQDNKSQFDMSLFINKFKKLETGYTDSDDKDMTFVAEDKNMKIKVLFTYLSINKESGDIYTYSTKWIMIKYLK